MQKNLAKCYQLPDFFYFIITSKESEIFHLFTPINLERNVKNEMHVNVLFC
uniref:Uncharacterized protein n=1 Tax=Anguilla anguilla TaxID=7936 RepID=A0A0E9S9V8_ANGAN